MFNVFYKKIKIPYHKQEKTYYCGPAVLQMVFEYFGFIKTQNYFAGYLETNKKIGTEDVNMIKTALSHGFYCYVNNNSTFFEIENFIDRGLPVIVRFLVPEFGIDEETNSIYEHFAIIKGYNRRKFIFNDPTYIGGGKNYKISKNKFLKKWYSNQEKNHNWILVISKEDLCLGKQYLPYSMEH